MSNFWPSGLELSDTQSPREILKAAQEDWQTSSDGVMDLVLQDAKSKSENSMIIVHAKHVVSNRTATLFSIVHRPNHPYPATIQLEEEDLPQFLQKTYYKGGSRDIADILRHERLDSLGSLLGSQGSLLGSQGSTVSNKWVSDTPAEFRTKLADAFNLGLIKGKILNLASISTENSDSTNGESPASLEEE